MFCCFSVALEGISIFRGTLAYMPKHSLKNNYFRKIVHYPKDVVNSCHWSETFATLKLCTCCKLDCTVGQSWIAQPVTSLDVFNRLLVINTLRCICVKCYEALFQCGQTEPLTVRDQFQLKGLKVFENSRLNF